MKTDTTTVQVQRLENKEDIGALIAGDIIEILDRDYKGRDTKLTAMIFCNEHKRREIIMPNPYDNGDIRSYGFGINDVDVVDGAMVLEEGKVSIEVIEPNHFQYKCRHEMLKRGGL